MTANLKESQRKCTHEFKETLEKTSMRKSDIWTSIFYGIVIGVPRSGMEM